MVYEATKPRAPIAAQYNSPGPMVYSLPALVGGQGHDPRSVKGKLPSWSFGVKHAKLVEDASPGPVHHPDPRFTKAGKDGTPHYSLYSRPKDPAMFKPPGPGSYSPEKVGPSAHPQSPRYSFGARTKYRSQDPNPSPNTYSLPQSLGKTIESGMKQKPIFSLRGRSKIGGFDEDLQRTPGPGTYGTIDASTYKKKFPQYSLGARREMPGDSTIKPGPGQHSPEKVAINRSSAPSHSFGVKHSDYLTPLIVPVAD